MAVSLLQSSVSHDPSEIILILCGFGAQETFLLSMLKTAVLLNIFVEYKKRIDSELKVLSIMINLLHLC